MELQPPLDYQFPLDGDFHQWSIGVIGAGFIVRDCHLPAYRAAGFHVAGICSRTAARASEVAEARGIEHVYADYHAMLADPQINVIDIAVPPQFQLDVIREVVQHADHVRGILAQKPLAMCYADAREIVRLCADAGITLAVNQNMRHDQSVRACKDLLNRGLLGAPVLGTIDMRAIPHWMPWSKDLPSLSTYVMSIHHLDTFRYWFGDPLRVMASTRPDPRTQFPHTDGINLYILEFESGCRASGWDDVWTGPMREGSAGDIGIQWRVEGTEGLARGTIGWPSYPQRTPSTLDYTTTSSNQWISPRWDEVWFPDAFRGTMGELLSALNQGGKSSLSGQDNLQTMAARGSDVSCSEGASCGGIGGDLGGLNQLFAQIAAICRKIRLHKPQFTAVCMA